VRYTYEVDGQRHEGNLIHPCYRVDHVSVRRIRNCWRF
jgi:hypothetical protein